jgi:uncharacterized protein YrrD
MLRNVEELYGYNVQATDGDIGMVHEFYFDDKFWTIRYLVVDTGGWLSGRRVLISPAALDKPNWGKEMLSVSITKEQVENSPSIDTDKPVSRQHEKELHEYYKWPLYWGIDPYAAEAGSIAYARYLAEREEKMKEAAKEQKQEEEEGDSHLRSTREVKGYHIHAKDGEIGHVEDFILDDEGWIIRYIVVDTRNWLPGKKVLVSPEWVERVSWSESEVYVDLLREVIKKSPEFDPSAPINRDYEENLYDYYGRPKYWTRTLEKRKEGGVAS